MALMLIKLVSKKSHMVQKSYLNTSLSITMMMIMMMMSLDDYV